MSSMRFFTRAWCNGELTEEESDAVFGAYRRHLAAIASLVPSGVLELSQQSSLHDALFKTVQFDQINRQLFLRLRCGELQYGYYDLSLHYTGATVIDRTPYGLSGLVAVAGVEVLYHEIDVTEAGRAIASNSRSSVRRSARNALVRHEFRRRGRTPRPERGRRGPPARFAGRPLVASALSAANWRALRTIVCGDDRSNRQPWDHMFRH